MNTTIKKIPSGEKKYKSLSSGLVFWFLLLSTLPLFIISIIGYYQTTQILTETITDRLEQTSNQSVHFIKNWFSYRLIDLKVQAESNNNINFLKTISEGFNKSGQSLSEYTKSYEYIKRIDTRQDELIKLSRQYDYIYDLFLLDVNGNLLFTVAHESDFGTNMLTGPYAKTLFSKSIKKTLETGEVNFSDLEHYAPSNNHIVGFLTAPLVDEYGNKVGVFAIQLRLDKIFTAIKNSSRSEKSLTHYLVGEDGKLRSAIHLGEENEVLHRNINTKQYMLWRQEHSYVHSDKNNLLDAGMDEVAIEYTGPNGDVVIGQHQLLSLPGVSWTLMSEVNKDEALLSVKWLFQVMVTLFIITIISVTLLAIYQARRISKPIIKLSEASLAATRVNAFHHVEVEGENEIAQLAESFNHMLDVRKKHEEELEQTTVQAEAAYLELAEQKFALDQHSIVAITDTKGIITFANKKFSEISGYDMLELVGQNHRILKSGVHDQKFFEDLYRTIANGDVWHGEVCNKAKDGHLYWLDSTIVPFKSDDGKPKSYIAIRTDITERKKSAADLIQAKELAEAATRQKSEFLANMSHEIRTPMNGVIGMTGLLLDTNLSSKQHDYAKNTMKSAEALLAIINDILDFSKIEAGKLELEILPFNILTLMEDVSELMAMKCQEKNIEMLLRFKPGTETLVKGDPGRIRQILLNLLSNAIKFTEEGSVLLTVESGEVIDGVTTFSVSVTDTGIGINDDKLNLVFNKFDQEDGSTTRKYGGTGLGLAICRQLCELMQGEVKVESHKGHGSVFSFTMKLEVVEDEVISSISLGNMYELNGLKTLIIDDLAVARMIMSEQISSLNLDVDMTSSGEEAIDKLKQANLNNKPFDIVITDFHMPEMDGEMLAAEIKNQSLLENGVLLFITSSPRKGDGIRLKDKGFDGYLTKPTRPQEVPQILSLIWEAKRQGKDIPLVTRHMIQEVKTGKKQKIKLMNTHVLLAEDNPVNQIVATEYLERYGCTVTPAGNGLEAVTEVKHSDFDLIFMDCQMPEMDGYEATGVIRQWQEYRNLKNTPIIAFTANAMQGDKEKCINAGMDDYITKPVSETSLEDILRKWLPEKVQMVNYTKDSKEDIEVPQDNEPSNSELDLSVFNTLKQMFGDAFIDAVESHTKSAKDNISRVEKALETNNASELEHAAHSLKGASAQFGAVSLYEISMTMEQLGKEGKVEEAKDLINKLKTAQADAERLMMQEVG